MLCRFVFFFKQKTAYEMRISDWSSDVCSSDLDRALRLAVGLPGESADRPAGDRPRGAPAEAARFGRALSLRPAGRSAVRRLHRVQPGAAGAASALRRRHHAVRHRARHHRSEEHTSELQSLMRISYAVFCLKKKKNKTT